MAESKKMVKKEVAFMKKKGAPKSMVKHEMAEAKDMKKGGKAKGYMFGGMLPGGKRPPAAAAPAPATGGMSKFANVKAAAKRFNMNKGGAIDGVASKGKTKGTMVKMAKGGMMKKGCK